MRLDVLLFAVLRDELGPSFAVEVPAPADVKTLRTALEAAHPAFARWGRRTRVAVNESYARDSDPLRPGDVVALLPPVCGG